MKRFQIVSNESGWQTDEVKVLLEVAYSAAKVESALVPHYPITVRLGKTKRIFCGSYGKTTGSVRLLFAAPDRTDGLPTSIGTSRCHNMNEVVVGLAAWMFMGVFGNSRLSQGVCHDAIRLYRDNEAKIKAKIAEVADRKKEKEGDAFAREVFQGLEQSTFTYKMNKLDEKEQAWQRKLKLATSKIKAIRRRKAALRAADTRKRKLEAVPPQPQETQ